LIEGSRGIVVGFDPRRPISFKKINAILALCDKDSQFGMS